MSCTFARVPCRLARLATPSSSLSSSSIRTRVPPSTTGYNYLAGSHRTKYTVRYFSNSLAARSSNEYDEKARKLDQKGLDEEEQKVRVKMNQTKRPWLRENADKPPAEQPLGQPSPKGKLLTTPTRLLKLILPLPVSVEKDQDNNGPRDYGRAISPNDTIQPLALLVHPQQPLSYVERLVQAELPPVVDEDGKERIPNIYFRAEDSATSDDNSAGPKGSHAKPQHSNEEDHKPSSPSASNSENGGNPHVASYSGLGHEAQGKDATPESEKRWVRWSSSTEMGDFIRDAARGREFAIEVEGYNLEMRVSVPSFRDRTYYLRMRLRRMSKQIEELAKIKSECDELAHKSAHRLAQGGFAALAGWWGVVYYVTFQTEWGWDLVEPVTYLVGLTTIMGGYLWFLYISKDLSYKAAMNVTVSRRQNALYEAKGFDMHRWEQLVQEANGLRREIKTIAAEYDVDWDEMRDLSYSKQVKKVLERERTKRGEKDDDEDADDEGEDEAEMEQEEKKVKAEMVSKGSGKS
ncbi:hypothetical protein BD289DRAFT_417219 [Coniella lustricola]|uniref:Calcium uniporter protein, mitochondrial n=1 Tax=Coniella lustricola TaxID=2025994 RepID=A0A2T2ZVP8_9PEZI|nr:hypothetical protein BD289DRAFT_417219 [Coniella lustricola]